MTSKTVYFSKVGQVCFMYAGLMTGTMSATVFTMSFSASIPSGYRPGQTTYFPIYVISGGSGINGWCRIYITTAGGFSVQPSPSTTSFASGAATSIYDFSISYLIA